jgi:tetratricopeptide (TPR) repeat protein
VIDQRPFPFGGVPVYNPQSLSKEEAIAQFHVRQSNYEHLMALLGQEQPPQVLIIGSRGMGKTTLLQRVRYGVEDDSELSRRYLVLVFPEEQYNVNHLGRFLLNTVDAVADAMERLGDIQAVNRIEAYADTLSKKQPGDVEEQVPQFLAGFGREVHRDFLLLVDNADRLFDMIDKQQQWRLRELLSSRKDLTFFGATTQASDAIYDHERAFFEFFQVQVLSPLSADEVRSLLLRLSAVVEQEEGEKGTARRRVNEWLDADAARLRTLVQLTGGNPRTTVLLFHLVLDGLQGGAREYLERLLDQVTPTYKGRVDELSPQAQQVFDAVALHWDPVTAMEVASESGIETAAVSTQLTRLVRQGILEKADPGDSRKALYQVAERFFNIWYLMRASRRVRAKLRWFVEFLRVFFDNEELEKIAWDQIERYRPTWRENPEEAETAFAYVIASGANRERVEEYLRRTCLDTEPIWRPYLSLMERPPERRSKPAQKKDDVNTEEEVRALIEREPGSAAHWVKLGNLLGRNPDRAAEAEAAIREAIRRDSSLAGPWAGLSRLARLAGRSDEAESSIRKALELEPSVARYWLGLGDVLAQATDRGEESEFAYRKAIELDPEADGSWQGLGRLLSKTPERAADAEAAYRKAIELNPKWDGSWQGLGRLLSKAPERWAEAEAAYRKAIGLDPKWAGNWGSLGDILAQAPGRPADAEAAYREAIELDPKGDRSWQGLGKLLSKTPERGAEAEAAYRKAIELDPEWGGHWGLLGDLLAKAPARAADAEAAYRKAIELDPEWGGHWGLLGDLLAKAPARPADAEAAYRKAIELDPREHYLWHQLGILLARVPARAAEAETAFRRANELNAECADCWYSLARLVARNAEGITEAEATFRKAIELNPGRAEYWNSLAILLAERPGRATEAETAFRKAIELEPDRVGFWGDLGRFLSGLPGRATEAEEALRKEIDLDPGRGWCWHRLGSLLAQAAERVTEAEAAFRKAIALEPKEGAHWIHLGSLLAETPERAAEAEAAYRAAVEADPESASDWASLGFFLACKARKPREAETALRNAVRLRPNDAKIMRNLGVLLYCEAGDPGSGSEYLERASQLDREPLSTAIAVSAKRGIAKSDASEFPVETARTVGFWDELLSMARNYPPFGKPLLGICDLVEERDTSNPFVRLYRSVALAQLADFPRASVAFEDALVGDPIQLLTNGQSAVETVLAAAVKADRVRDFIDLLDKKEWKDAWRPIYEALRAVETGSADHLKRIAVELRGPTLGILRRIAPELCGTDEKQRDAG